MKYCRHCGGQLEDVAKVCVHCGMYVDNPEPQSQVQDAPSTGYAILGFFLPIVGLVLWAVWKEKYPQRANSAGKGALIGFIVSIVLNIIRVILLALVS